MKNGDFIATSYEHDTYGATSEDPHLKMEMTKKRFHKTESLFDTVRGYEILHPEARKMLVTVGMTSMVAREFIMKNPEYGLILLKYLKPFDVRIRDEIQHVEEFTVLEMNYGGQLSELFRREVGHDFFAQRKLFTYGKYDLFPFTRESFDTIHEERK